MTDHRTWRWLLTAAAGLGACFLGTGCSNVGPHGGAWLSDDDIQSCRAGALAAFAAGSKIFEIDATRRVIVRVDDWRLPKITVYLPMKEKLPAGLTYVYYTYQASERFVGRAQLSRFSARKKQKLSLVEHGIESWGTGPMGPGAHLGEW